MKLYLAGLYASNFHMQSQLFMRCSDREKKARADIAHYLESYHYIHKGRYLERIRQDGKKVFLDSGAFSAFTKGATIDINAYVDYIKRNVDIIETVDGQLLASVLDGIGDPQLTWENQQTMERMGVKPLPCFHYGEDERYLEYYIANYDYITLGGMVPISTPQLEFWLDRIWSRYLTDGSGNPKVRVHGFGLTALGLADRYPWYSVDSSSWIRLSFNGYIFVPDIGIIPASATSPQRHKAGAHVDTINDVQREAVRKYLEDEGFDLERLQTIYIARWAYNVHVFNERNNWLNRKPAVFVDPQMRLF